MPQLNLYQAFDKKDELIHCEHCAGYTWELPNTDGGRIARDDYLSTVDPISCHSCKSVHMSDRSYLIPYSVLEP